MKSTKGLLSGAALIALAACFGSDSTTLGPNDSIVGLAVAAAIIPSPANADAGPIHRIRAVTVRISDEAVLDETVLDVSPTADAWELELVVELEAPEAVYVYIYLINVVEGTETIEFSGRSDPLELVPGGQAPLDVPIVRGPLENLFTTGVDIVESPSTLLTGGTATLLGEVTTTAETPPTIFWTPLDEAVATMVDATVTAEGPGTTMIVASAGAYADTASLTVYDVLAITTDQLPDGRLDVPYGPVALVASGGDGDYSWRVSQGSLPFQLGLDPVSGEITGTPGENETRTFTIEVTSGDGQIATREYTVTIDVSQAAEYCDGNDSPPCGLTVVRVPDDTDVLCTDEIGEANCPQVGQPLYGQDRNYTSNPERPIWLTSPDSVLSETVSGLFWHPHAVAAASFTEATSVCATFGRTQYGGRGDWRVPSLREMGRILNSLPVWPAGMQPRSNSVWWTTDVEKAAPTNHFSFSGNWPWTITIPAAGGGPFDGAMYVYCVAGPLMAGGWAVNPDGLTVTHTTTDLMWHRAPSANTQMDWATAIDYCEASTVSGFTDWRLPTMREYISVLDYWSAGDYMSAAFQGVGVATMLTGTPNRLWPQNAIAEIAWVNEVTGEIRQESFATLTGAARCVRGTLD